MTTRLTLLGTGSGQLNVRRAAASVLVEDGTLRLVYDFGYRVAVQLLSLGIGANDLQHIVISHFHPDHSSDLIPYLHSAFCSHKDPRRAPLHIYGPPGIEALVHKLLVVYGDDELHRFGRYTLEVHEVSGTELFIENCLFEFVPLPPKENRGLVFRRDNKRIALTGDSFFHEQEVAFVSGADLAVIDAGHLTPRQITELAGRANPKVLVCSHLYDELDEIELQRAAERSGFTGALQVASDGDSFFWEADTPIRSARIAPVASCRSGAVD